MIKCIDRENKFIEIFNPKTGLYARSGVMDGGKDTGVDPFMRGFPALIDVGVMGWCVHGATGFCMMGGVQCYQSGLNVKTENMSLENFKRIVDECKGKTYQFALGGRGDVDQHKNFEDILAYCQQNGIVPNFTSSGFGFTDRIVQTCKRYCGAIAISWYRQAHTSRAIDMLIRAGVKTNIHYVLGNNSIEEAIQRLKENSFPKGINAVIFLLHKPVGLGSEKNVLKMDNPLLSEFFSLIDEQTFDFKVGFDSCSVPAILNLTNNIDRDSIDTCEGGRYSAYIDAEINMMPCSFDNEDKRWSVSLNEFSIEEAWNSKQFNDFRGYFRTSCPDCEDRHACMGGCPICPQIVLCDSEDHRG